jgi:ketosteroid isomerase-like protein
LESNVEIYRRAIDAFNRDGVEGVLPFISEEVEVYDPDLPPGEYEGHHGVRLVLTQLTSGFQDVEVLDFRLLAAGDRVVALTRTRGQGERTDLQVELSDAHTVTIRDGKIVYWRLYLDQGEALTDAGLDPALALPESSPKS